MNNEFEYDPESGSFRPRTPQVKRKSDGDIGSWIFIAVLFMIWWPLGLFALWGKLSDSPRKKTAHTARTAGSGGMRTSASPNAAAAPRGQNRVEKTVKKMARAPESSDKTARVLTIVGGILAACFGVALIPQIAEIISSGWYSYMLEDILSTGGFLAGGLVMLAAGRRMHRRSVRIARYLAVMGERSYIGIDELCAVSGKRRKTVERDLEFMVEKGMLSAGAYFDSGRGMFFRSAEAFAEYAEEKSRRENVTPKEANEGYAGALRAIRAANDRIADPVLSEKIDHLELVAGKIFREVEEHPEKQRQAATFLNYYLPTTLKLLDSYAKFEEAGIEGENLSRAQERIEETMDALVKGFDKQLDDLYRNEAMDIDSDIRVMENMLRRDTASVEEDFGLGGAAVQRVPEEE